MANLSVIEKKPCREVIDAIELLLSQAIAGEIIGVVTIISWDDNTTSHGWAGVKGNAVRITGELMVAATSLAKNIDESRI